MLNPVATLTLAHESDILEILAMRKEFYKIDQYDFEESTQFKITKDFILNPQLGRCWIIKLEELTAGYICLTFDFSFEYGGKIAFVDELYIKPEYRKKGIGSKILPQIIEKAKTLKIMTLLLESEKHNVIANKLYQKNGFKSNERYLLHRNL